MGTVRAPDLPSRGKGQQKPEERKNARPDRDEDGMQPVSVQKDDLPALNQSSPGDDGQPSSFAEVLDPRGDKLQEHRDNEDPEGKNRENTEYRPHRWLNDTSLCASAVTISVRDSC